MMHSFHLAVVLAAALFSINVDAKSSNVYSFRGGKSSSEGLKHGARGLDCLKNLIGEDKLTHHINTTIEAAIEDVSQDELSVAVFMSFGKEGIDRVCHANQQQEHNRKLRENYRPEPPKKKRRLQEEAACSSEPVDAGYPGTGDGGSVYTAYAVSGNIDAYLPDGAPYTSRTDPKKVIQQAQVVLDDALEAEYHGVLCEGYFDGVADLLSIPDFVVVKQGAILDGINSLTCGIAQGVARGTQAEMRTNIAFAQKHDTLVNEAETRATYMNTNRFAESVCSLSTEMLSLNLDILVVKEELETRRKRA
ncbi:expressed unknown protein [Seminavis robusta]|uniref:Uncharacterized protein n=1 Tax=Seminavis robusta TaxID=568900 RepID=A0A9N8E3H4_9STRA|nr:expressed unknown protein [Seminavis robusta]|eukprot:Sro614_g175780.1 n/a (306) ;mRNA; r:42373-43290